MARHKRGYIYEAFGAFHVRYYVTEIVEGKPEKKQRSHKLCDPKFKLKHVASSVHVCNFVYRVVRCTEKHQAMNRCCTKFEYPKAMGLLIIYVPLPTFQLCEKLRSVQKSNLIQRRSNHERHRH